MAIFESKEWWSTQVAKNEEFDSKLVCVENIDNESPPVNKIVVGSFSGTLRIFEPSLGNYSLDNLKMETKFESAILQIAAGSFSFSSEERQLAIMLNKKVLVLNVFNLNKAPTLRVVYEHKLPRNGYSFCLGRVGSKKFDIIFCQSIDGTISIFEQESHVNSFTLNDLIFPGAMNFVAHSDVLLIANSCYEIECYPYNNIAAQKKDAKIVYSWKTNLGEMTKVITTVTFKDTKTTKIFVLTDSFINYLDDNGKLVQQKKLDFDPMGLLVYEAEVPDKNQTDFGNVMLIVTTSAKHVFVFRGLAIIWAFRLQESPIWFERGDFKGNKGLLACLSDSGVLSVNYLKTDLASQNKLFEVKKALEVPNMLSEIDRLNAVVESAEEGVTMSSNHTLELSVGKVEVFFDEDFGDDPSFLTYGSKVVRVTL